MIQVVQQGFCQANAVAAWKSPYSGVEGETVLLLVFVMLNQVLQQTVYHEDFSIT